MFLGFEFKIFLSLTDIMAKLFLVNIHGYNSWLKITVIKPRPQQKMEIKTFKNIVVKISTVNVSGHYAISIAFKIKI